MVRYAGLRACLTTCYLNIRVLINNFAYCIDNIGLSSHKWASEEMKTATIVAAMGAAQLSWAMGATGHPFAPGIRTKVMQHLGSPDSQLQRNLQGGSATDFQESICDPLAQDFVSGSPGSTCTCDTENLDLVCTTPSDCSENHECDTDVCFSSQITVDFEETDNGELDLASIETIGAWTGAAYQQERGIMNETSCEAYFTLNNVEYRCNACTVCGDDLGYTLDCSNIQENAVDEVCIDSEDKERYMDRFFDVCPDEGPETPTTPGTPAKPIAFSSASHMTVATAVSAAIIAACLFA